MFGSDTWGNLASLYDSTSGNGETTFYPDTLSTLGAACFNDTYSTLLLTTYQGTLTKEEQTIGKTKQKVMSMHLQVEGKEYYYTYDFYKIDDHRVMISLYRSDADGNKIDTLGEVSDFYISTSDFELIVNNYIKLLNGQFIETN